MNKKKILKYTIALGIVKKLAIVIFIAYSLGANAQETLFENTLVKIGKQVYDKYPEKLYVNSVELREIPAKYITVMPDLKILGTEQFLGALVAWGQGIQYKNGVVFNNGAYITASKVPSKAARLKTSIVGYLNLLDHFGWQYVEKVDFYQRGYLLFKKKE